jgi:hypothetical protein
MVAWSAGMARRTTPARADQTTTLVSRSDAIHGLTGGTALNGGNANGLGNGNNGSHR